MMKGLDPSQSQSLESSLRSGKGITGSSREEPQRRFIQLERKSFSMEKDFVGAVEVIKITERGYGVFSSWLEVDNKMISWMTPILISISKGESGKVKWSERLGEDVYLMHLQSNDAGEYLRLSRFRKDGESKKFSICFPGGENREDWSMLAEVMETFLHRKPSNPVATLQDVTSFPQLSNKEERKWGGVW